MKGPLLEGGGELTRGGGTVGLRESSQFYRLKKALISPSSVLFNQMVCERNEPIIYIILNLPNMSLRKIQGPYFNGVLTVLCFSDMMYMLGFKETSLSKKVQELIRKL